MTSYEPWTASRGAEIIAEHAGLEGPALPILRALQDAFGYVPGPAVPQIAAALNLTRAEVHGIVSFYHELRRHAPGRHVLRLCRAESCQAMGAERLAQQAKARLGIDWHETTADGAVTLEPVFCLGLCAVSPSGMLDGDPLGRLDAVRLAAALDGAP
ncbi:MAG TPA: formate dehydrogenase subunit gamma [Acetobacteraceae bacterium]|nr:formate dehydrogenase subunit gamma [Acetobacteraceae bacterium]